MLFETVKDRLQQGTWRVEAIGQDGIAYQATFFGPDAEARAVEYADWKNTPLPKKAN